MHTPLIVLCYRAACARAQGRKELAVSLFQACVLLMFNTVEADEEVPFEAIQQHTGLGAT